MTVEEAIWTRVAGLTPVTTITPRVYLEKVAQGARYPLVLVQLISDPTQYHNRGPINSGIARIQVDATGQEASGVNARAQAEDLAAAIDGDGKGKLATGLSGFIGPIGSTGLYIQGIFRINRMPRLTPEEFNTFTMIQEYFVRYKTA